MSEGPETGITPTAGRHGPSFDSDAEEDRPRRRQGAAVLWCLCGFLYPGAVAILCGMFWRTHPPTGAELAAARVHPDVLVLLADLLALAHVVGCLGAIAYCRGARLVAAVGSSVQLFVMAGLWFEAQMALSGGWL
jgi:hypothetical protein